MHHGVLAAAAAGALVRDFALEDATGADGKQLEQEILHLPQLQRKSDVHHDGELDHLREQLRYLKGLASLRGRGMPLAYR